MRAIVLSCDRYVSFTNHMIHTYQKIWPSHPFRFVVPYQKYPEWLKDRYGEKIELVQTERDIKPTVRKLLESVDDEEWVYWCIDDKYLIEINEVAANEIYSWVNSISDTSIAGITFCRRRKLLKRSFLDMMDTIKDDQQRVYIRRKKICQMWIHQFFRAKVLKRTFDSFPDRSFIAKEMDYWVVGKRIPANERWYVLDENIVEIGESTRRGKILRNCLESFKRHGLPVPKHFDVMEKGKQSLTGKA